MQKCFVDEFVTIKFGTNLSYVIKIFNINLFFILFLKQNISVEKLNRIFEAMETNTNLKILNMSNVDMTDSVGKVNMRHKIIKFTYI